MLGGVHCDDAIPESQTKLETPPASRDRMTTEDQHDDVVYFLLGDSPPSGFIYRRFGTLLHLHTYLPMKMEQTVFRNVGI